ISVAAFVVANVLQLFFAITLTRWLGTDHPILPTSGIYPPGHKGFDPVLRAKYLVLPVIVVSIQIIAVYSRYMRASLLEVKNSDYLRTARAKGISERRILENRGMGDFFLTAYTNGDFPQLMPWMVFVTLGVILANLFADVLYAVLDPRIRLD